MKDRKLRLVKAPGRAPAATNPAGSSSAPAGGGDEPPFTDDELREAEAFGQAIERGDEPISSSLRAAWRPEVLDAAAHDALVERAMKEVDPIGQRGPVGSEPPPSPEETAAAERLRASLERRSAPVGAPEAELAEALRAAVRPTAIDPRRNEVLIATALANAPRRLTVTRLFATVATVTALAAGVALLLRTQAMGPPASDGAAAPAAVAAAAASPIPALIRARSTEDLFDAAEPFPRKGGESKRIDKIASSRAADLRANRFAAWGVSR